MAYVFMAVTTLLWGTASAAAGLLGDAVSPAVLGLLRNGFALVFFVPLALAGGWSVKPNAAGVRANGIRSDATAAAAGLLGYGSMQLFFFLAAQTTASGHVVLIMSLVPLAVHVATSVMRRTPMRPATFAGHVIALLGLAVAVGGPSGAFGSIRAGDGYALLAMLSFAGYSLLIGKLKPGYPQARANIVGLAAGSVPLAAVAAASAPLAWPGPDAGQWTAIAYLGVLCTGAANWLYQIAMRRGPAVKLINIIYFQPVVGMIPAVLLLDEQLTWAWAGGTLLCMAGVMIHGRTTMPTSKKKVEDPSHTLG